MVDSKQIEETILKGEFPYDEAFVENNFNILQTIIEKNIFEYPKSGKLIYDKLEQMDEKRNSKPGVKIIEREYAHKFFCFMLSFVSELFKEADDNKINKLFDFLIEIDKWNWYNFFIYQAGDYYLQKKRANFFIDKFKMIFSITTDVSALEILHRFLYDYLKRNKLEDEYLSWEQLYLKNQKNLQALFEDYRIDDYDDLHFLQFIKENDPQLTSKLLHIVFQNNPPNFMIKELSTMIDDDIDFAENVLEILINEINHEIIKEAFIIVKMIKYGTLESIFYKILNSEVDVLLNKIPHDFFLNYFLNLEKVVKSIKVMITSKKIDDKIVAQIFFKRANLLISLSKNDIYYFQQFFNELFNIILSNQFGFSEYLHSQNYHKYTENSNLLNDFSPDKIKLFENIHHWKNFLAFINPESNISVSLSEIFDILFILLPMDFKDFIINDIIINVHSGVLIFFFKVIKSLHKEEIEKIKSSEKYLAIKQINEVRSEEQRKSKEKLENMIQQYTHTLANTLFPDTIYEVAQKLKKHSEYKKDAMILSDAYQAELFMKHQGQLLAIRNTLNEASFQSFIRRDRLDNGTNIEAASIEDILAQSLERVMSRFLNDDYHKLESIRKALSEQLQTKLETWKDRFEKEVFFEEQNIISWVNQHFIPLKITIAESWKNIRLQKNKYASSLLQGYFSELLFNALKYRKVNSEYWVEIDFADEVIENETYLVVTFQNQYSEGKNISISSGKGLISIKSDLEMLNEKSDESRTLKIEQKEANFTVKLVFKKDLFILPPPIKVNLKNLKK